MLPSRRGVSQKNRRRMAMCINHFLILAFSIYVAVDISIHLRSRERRPETSQPYEPETCATRDGHYETTSESDVERNPWHQMKWIGEAARCRVKGHLIEKLDDINNFRRGFALKFAPSVVDKTHLLPWLLAARTSELGSRRRRVYIDLGAGTFNSSVEWFLRMYPCDFTEIYAFEIDPLLWQPPEAQVEEGANFLAADVPTPDAVRVRSTPGVPRWMMERVKVYFQAVSDVDDPSTNAVNITRFMKEELGLTPEDTVVVKMDIEGAEWPILLSWLKDPLMPRIVDELFVETHYGNPSMVRYDWDKFYPVKREDALRVFADLRWHGFYAHFWP